MAAGVYNIKVEQGVTRSFAGQYLLPDGITPKDLTGFSGRGALKLNHSDCTNLADFDVSISNFIEGRFVVTLPASALTDKKLRSKRSDGLVEAVYDIELFTASDATVIRVLQGTVLISLEVTK